MMSMHYYFWYTGKGKWGKQNALVSEALSHSFFLHCWRELWDCLGAGKEGQHDMGTEKSCTHKRKFSLPYSLISIRLLVSVCLPQTSQDCRWGEGVMQEHCSDVFLAICCHPATDCGNTRTLLWRQDFSPGTLMRPTLYLYTGKTTLETVLPYGCLTCY